MENTTYILIFYITKVSLGIFIGTLIYFLVINGTLGSNIKNKYLSYKGSNRFYIHLTLIVMLIYMLIYLIDYIFIDNLNHWYSNNIGSDVLLSSSDKGVVVNGNVGGLNIPSDGIKQVSSALGNGGIMGAAIAGGYKIATTSHTLDIKVSAIAGSVAVGGLAIIATDASSLVKDFSLNGNHSTSSLMSSNKFTVLLERSGDPITDLLYALGSIQSLELTFAILIGWYLILIYLKPKLIIISEKLPLGLKPYFLKLLNYSDNINYGLIIFFWFLLIVSLLFSNHYFNFLIDNFDIICETYLKNK